MEELPPFVRAERDAIIAEVYEAFAGVSREGGVSWSETYEIDLRCYPEGEQAARQTAARAKDLDTDWTQLVDDPEWHGKVGIGGWNFLDAIGFRYYLPVEMVRCLRQGWDDGDGSIAWSLKRLKGPFQGHRLEDISVKKWALLNDRQRRCVKRFLLYMAILMKIEIAETTELGNANPEWSYETRWEDAYASYWKGVPDEE